MYQHDYDEKRLTIVVFVENQVCPLNSLTVLIRRARRQNNRLFAGYLHETCSPTMKRRRLTR